MISKKDRDAFANLASPFEIKTSQGLNLFQRQRGPLRRLVDVVAVVVAHDVIAVVVDDRGVPKFLGDVPGIRLNVMAIQGTTKVDI